MVIFDRGRRVPQPGIDDATPLRFARWLCVVACTVGVCWALAGASAARSRSVGADPAATAAAGSSWSWSSPETVDPPVPGEGFFFLGGISCPSVSLCVAVDGANGTVGHNDQPIVGGRLFSTTEPTGPASAWHGINVDPSNAIRDIACPSVSLCVAVDSGGNVLTSTAPSGGLTAWQITPVNSTSFTALSCSSPSLCVGIDSGGNVWTTTDPGGGAGAWQDDGYLPGPGGSLLAPDNVACAPAAAGPLCVALAADEFAGEAVFTTTDPAAGAGAWAFGGDIPIDRQTVGFWGPESLSCPSVSLCLAVDSAGDVISSTSPAAGATSWDVEHIAGSLQGLSCESTTLCFAYQGEENQAVFLSTDPAGGAASWSTTGASYTTGVSCPSPSLCIAAGENGPNGGSVQVGTLGGGQGTGGSHGGSGGRGKTRSETVRVAGGKITVTLPKRCTSAGGELAVKLTFTRAKGRRGSLPKVYRVDYKLGSGKWISVRHAPFDAALRPSSRHRATALLTVRPHLLLADGKRSTRTIRLRISIC